MASLNPEIVKMLDPNVVRAVQNRRWRNKRTGKRINFDGLLTLVDKAVDLAEAGFGAGNGEVKKKAVVDLLNDWIDLPLVPEPLEGALIGLAIDGLVALKHARNLF